MRYLAFLSFLVILAGCKNSGEKDLPQGLMKDSIIPQTEMINILADILVACSQLQLAPKLRATSQGIYQETLEVSHISAPAISFSDVRRHRFGR